jgi:hypothetical protein
MDTSTPQHPPPRPIAYESRSRHSRQRGLEWYVGTAGLNLWLPIVLIVIGTGLYFARATMLFDSLHEAIAAAGVQMCANIVILLMTVLIVRKVTDMDVGLLAPAALKIVATALLPNAVGGMIMLLGGCSGVMIALFVSFVLYWTLFALLFQIGVYEAVLCVAVAWFLGVVSWFFVNTMLMAWLK